jgi:transposase InsO family protein
LDGIRQWRIVEIGTHRIVPKKSEERSIIDYYFTEFKGLAALKLSIIISREYSGMGEKLVRRHLNDLQALQRRTPMFTNKAPLRPVTSNRVMSRVQIDFSSLTVEIDDSKYCYVLSVLDIFSRYLWLRPLCNKTSQGVAEKLFDIFIEHGCPDHLLMDNGGEFKAVVNELTEKLKVKTIRGAPYHPQTQGKVCISLFTGFFLK